MSTPITPGAIDDPKYDPDGLPRPQITPMPDEAPTGGANIALAQGANFRVGIHPQDKKYGLAATGAAGSGKTSLLTRAAIDNAFDPNCALIVLDPKSDLVFNILSAVPASRRVWILDLAKPEFGINFMSMHPHAHTVADIVISAFKDLNGDDAIQASSDRYLRQSIVGAIALAKAEGRAPTLWDAYALLQPKNHSLRSTVADICMRDTSHQMILTAEFFAVSLPGDLGGAETMTTAKLDAPRNKIERLLGDPRIDVMLRHPRQVSMLDIIRNRDILIVRGNLGTAGRANVATMLTMILGMVHSAMSRQQDEIDRKDRARVSLILDEAHLMVNDTLAQMMAIHRDAGLEVAAALQYTSQIQSEVALAGWMNLLQHRAAFRTRDATEAKLVSELMMSAYTDQIRADQQSRDAARFTPDVLLNLQNFYGLASFIAHGVPRPAFPIRTFEAFRNPRLIEHHLQAQIERGCFNLSGIRAIHDPRRYVDGEDEKRAKAMGGAVVERAPAMGTDTPDGALPIHEQIAKASDEASLKGHATASIPADIPSADPPAPEERPPISRPEDDFALLTNELHDGTELDVPLEGTPAIGTPDVDEPPFIAEDAAPAINEAPPLDDEPAQTPSQTEEPDDEFAVIRRDIEPTPDVVSVDAPEPSDAAPHDAVDEDIAAESSDDAPVEHPLQPVDEQPADPVPAKPKSDYEQRRDLVDAKQAADPKAVPDSKQIADEVQAAGVPRMAISDRSLEGLIGSDLHNAIDQAPLGTLLSIPPPLYDELQTEIKRDVIKDPTAKPVDNPKVDAGDLKILATIYHAKVMTQAQLGLFGWGDAANPTRSARKWAGRMYDFGLIRRMRFSLKQRGRAYPIYCLTNAGQKLLRETNIPGSEKTYIKNSGDYQRFDYLNSINLLHDLRAVGWMLAVEHYGTADLGPRGKSVERWHGPGSGLCNYFRIANTDSNPTASGSRRARQITSTAEAAGAAGLGNIGGLTGEEPFADIRPDGVVEIIQRRDGETHRIDALVEFDQSRSPGNANNQRKLLQYDQFFTAWWVGLSRYRQTGNAPFVFFVCEDEHVAKGFAMEADKLVTGYRADRNTGPMDYYYPGRERMFFCCEVDAYQGTLRSYMLPRRPPEARKLLGEDEECILERGTLIPRRALSRVSLG